ncbi:hypothetical protein C5E45_20165 [Nocardia nova]|uniref:Uncharacterized protein n=1 Tax=Nocardia nova TaxID=37330 RepID=A0A2S6AMB6_9NOCA|nr:hypothetical protein C5E45_20165 [Nocardia nova]
MGSLPTRAFDQYAYILDKVPAGGYARFVQAVCSLIPNDDPEYKEWRTKHGRLEFQAFQSCVMVADPRVDIHHIIDTQTLFDPQNPQDQKDLDYIKAVWNAVEEDICPQFFNRRWHWKAPLGPRGRGDSQRTSSNLG